MHSALKRQGAVDVALFSAIFVIVSRLLIRAISNLALQAIEKDTDVRRKALQNFPNKEKTAAI